MRDVTAQRAEIARKSAAMHLPVVWEYDRKAGQPELYQTPDGRLFDDWDKSVAHCEELLGLIATYDKPAEQIFVFVGRLRSESAKREQEAQE